MSVGSRNPNSQSVASQPKGTDPRPVVAVQLTVDQIQRNWKGLRKAIYEILPPLVKDEPGLEALIRDQLADGTMQAWVAGYQDQNGKTDIRLIATTQIVPQHMSPRKNLLIFSLFSFGGLDDRVWQKGMDTLVRFARGKGCSRVQAFTQEHRVTDIAGAVGGDASWRLIQWEVE